MKNVTLSKDRWLGLCERIFVGWGAAEESAAIVARSLVESDRAGVPSHGLARIIEYLSYVKSGWLLPGATPRVVRETPLLTVFDGGFGLGQPAAHRALQASIAKARESGMAAASLVHCGHIGRLGEYAESAAEASMVSLITASSGGAGGMAVPFGGAERVFSTNPIAAGVPGREHEPFIMDFATTVMAAGKFEMFPDNDKPIPSGVAVDSDGNPAHTVREFLNGGGLLPFGGHKGYALALLVELLCGALTGAGVASEPSRPKGLGTGGNAGFMIVFDISHFTQEKRFFDDVDSLFDRLESVRPAPGYERVMVPGAPEREKRARYDAEGITVPESTWRGIVELAHERDIDLEPFLS